MLITCVIALALLAPSLDGADVRRPLDIWTVNCANEHALWEDLRNDQQFRTLVEQHYVLREIPIRSRPIDSLLRGITTGPTFVTPGRPYLIGYRGKRQFLHELGIPQQLPTPVQMVAPPPAAKAIELGELKISLSRLLKAEIQATEERLQRSQSEAIRNSQTQVLSQFQSLSQRLDQQQVSSKDTLTRLTEVAEAFQRLQADQSHKIDSERSNPEVAPESAPASRLKRVFTLGQLVVAAATGGSSVGISFLAAQALLSWRSRRKQKRKNVRHIPASVDDGTGVGSVQGTVSCANCAKSSRECVDQVRTIQSLREQLAECENRAANTNFAPFETRTFREAYEYAARETVKRYPGTADGFAALESTMKQYLGSKGVDYDE